ncbi:MAG TPA: Imm5 family immunity protein [Roseiflexaceae bacterium]|nr:Imm5 family immunity protein [Roseiflexaceae bacterium]
MVLHGLPAPVAARADEALRALFRHPERTLLPWYRYALYTALAADEAGRGGRAQAWLEILAVQRVLFCWRPLAHSPRHPVRAQPDALLTLAADVIRGAAERALASATLNYARAYCDVAGELPTSPHYPAWCVYEAAARALERACALAGQECGTGWALDDAAGYAAIAVSGAGQPTADPHSQVAEDARLRRAVFWEWWLRTALPQAIARAAQ